MRSLMLALLAGVLVFAPWQVTVAQEPSGLGLTQEDVGSGYFLDPAYSGVTDHGGVQTMTTFYRRPAEAAAVLQPGPVVIATVAVTTDFGFSPVLLNLMMLSMTEAMVGSAELALTDGPAVGEHTQWFTATAELDFLPLDMRYDVVGFIVSDVGFIVVTGGLDGRTGPEDTAHFAQIVADRVLEEAAR
jgi:hypothetical protein